MLPWQHVTLLVKLLFTCKPRCLQTCNYDQSLVVMDTNTPTKEEEEEEDEQFCTS